jgi:DNA polymerase III epsilon subunit-like protein
MKKATLRNSIICLDFETGGLDAQKQAITQIAFISFEASTFKEINRYESYVSPYGNYQYEDKALEMTGVTYEKIESGKDIRTVVKEISELFSEANTSGHTKKPILLGHNIPFDISFLQQIFAFTKTDLSKYFDGKKDFYGNFSPNYLDTLYMSKAMWANDESMQKFKLENCCSKAGVDLVDAHSALNDVVATKELFMYLINNMRSEASISTSEDIKKTKFRTTFQF